MAQEHGNGGGQDPMLKALKDVVAEVHEVASELRGFRADTNARFERVEAVLLDTRHEVRETNVRLGKLEVGFADLRAEVHEGFADLGQKLDSAAHRDHHLEERVEQLGDRVARLEVRNLEPR